MLKATRVRAVLLGLLTVFFVSGPVFAEVQNVKVGGELSVKGFNRRALRSSEDVPNGTGLGSITSAYSDSTASDEGESSDYFLQQLTALDVEGDLTENVKVRTRIINQRVWGGLNDSATGAASGTGSDDVSVSLANVTLKELFYSPLTLVLGRQRLWYGRGFVVGSRLLHGDIDQGDGLASDEYSDLTGFDAARVILDLSGSAPMGMPVTVDAVYAKVDEGAASNSGNANINDDVDLFGINLASKTDNGEFEAYWFRKQVANLPAAGSRTSDDPQANTIGLRGSVTPSEGSSVWGELAYQFGNAISTAASAALQAEGAAGDRYQAWAANLGGDVSISDTTKAGLEWIWYKGRENTVTAIKGWDPMYRGAFTTANREFQAAGFYPAAQSGATVNLNTFNLMTASNTNQHQFAGHVTLSPIEDLTVDNRLTWFRADVGIVPIAGAKREHDLGWEYDLQANYAYTDDVNLGFLYGVFFPGSAFRDPFDNRAQQFVTSVNVKF